jgi:hypothetical protein
MAASIARGNAGTLEIHFERKDRAVFSRLAREATPADWVATLGTAIHYGGTECAQSVIDAMAALVADQRAAVQWIRKGERFSGVQPSRTATEDELDLLLAQYAALQKAVRGLDAQLRADLERLEAAALLVALDDARLSRLQIRKALAGYFDVDATKVDKLPDHALWLGPRPRLRPEDATRLQNAMTDIDAAYARWTSSPTGHGSAKARAAQERSRIWAYSAYRTLVRKAAAIDPVIYRVVPKFKSPPGIDDRVFDALALAWENALRLADHVQRRGDVLREVQGKLNRAFEAEARRKGPPSLIAVDAYRDTLEGVADEIDAGPYVDPSVIHRDGTGVWAYPALIQRTMNLMGLDEWSPTRAAASEVTLGPNVSLVKSVAEMLVVVGAGMLASGAGAPAGIAVEVISNGFLAARDLMDVLERQDRESLGAGFSLDPEDSYGPRLQPVSDAALGASFVGTTFPYSHLIPGRFGAVLGFVAPLAASWLVVPTEQRTAPGAAR